MKIYSFSVFEGVYGCASVCLWCASVFLWVLMEKQSPKNIEERKDMC